MDDAWMVDARDYNWWIYEKYIERNVTFRRYKIRLRLDKCGQVAALVSFSNFQLSIPRITSIEILNLI